MAWAGKPKIGRHNNTLTFPLKVAMLTLGDGVVATLWEAVIEDVSGTFLAIMNAVRIQQIKLVINGC